MEEANTASALKPALGVAARVDQVRVFERKLVRAEQDVVHSFDTDYKAVVLVRHFVLHV